MGVEGIMPNDPRYESQGIGLYRKWFREAVDHSKK